MFGAAAATAGYAVTWLAAAVALLVAAGLMLVASRMLRERTTRTRPGPAA